MTETIEVLKYPDPRLFRVAEEVGLKEALGIVNQLNDVVKQQYWGEPVGFAAPQIGINKRVFVALGRVFINPHTTWAPRGPKRLCLEGCYSLDEDRFDYEVWRYPTIKASWTDEDGVQYVERLYNYEAQVFQHEYQHLEGVLCNGSGV